MSEAIVRRTPDPYVTVTLPGIVIGRELEAPASTLRPAIEKLLARMGDRKISIVVTSLDPPDVEETFGGPTP